MKAPYITLPEKTIYGGKGSSGTYQRIINEIPPHDVFVSGFLGHCAIMRHKKPAVFNVGFDMNMDTISMWKNEVYKKQAEWSTKDKPGHNLHFGNTRFYAQSFMAQEEYFKTLKPTGEMFLYLDPPYPLGTRSRPQERYKYEMTDADHMQLLRMAGRLRMNIAISTYPNDMYDYMLKGWRKIEFQSSTRGGMKTEFLYMNYDKPTRLHDYNYLGVSAKKREQWRKKLRSLMSKTGLLTELEQGHFFQELQKEYNL